MDLAGFDAARLETTTAVLREFAERLGIPEFRAIPVVATTASSLEAPGTVMPWYRGPSLISHLEAVAMARPDSARPLRFPVRSATTSEDGARAICGRLLSGSVRMGDAVTILPSARSATIARIASAGGDVAEAAAGDEATLVLSGDIEAVEGDVIVAPEGRPEVADQVASIGGQYLEVIVPDEAKEVSADGYAKATSEAYDRRAAEIYSEQAADVDIIITTALIPGRAAPRLITAADVASMKPGSVIVDMAAAQGGNVEGSVEGERVVTQNGVVILGFTDLPGRLPQQASQLFGTNLVNLLKLLTPGKDGRLTLDFDDVVQRTVTVVRRGEKTWPPPPVQVSAAAPKAAAAASAPVEPKKPMSAGVRGGLVAAGIAVLFAVCAFAPPPLPQHFLVLTLSVVVGFYVIGHVAHALHTPLMSVTNAISGIIIVGAMVQITAPDLTVQILAAAGVLLASINIFGGFAVTRRMLAMFQKGQSR